MLCVSKGQIASQTAHAFKLHSQLTICGFIRGSLSFLWEAFGRFLCSINALLIKIAFQNHQTQCSRRLSDYLNYTFSHNYGSGTHFVFARSLLFEIRQFFYWTMIMGGRVGMLLKRGNFRKISIGKNFHVKQTNFLHSLVLCACWLFVKPTFLNSQAPNTREGSVWVDHPLPYHLLPWFPRRPRGI